MLLKIAYSECNFWLYRMNSFFTRTLILSWLFLLWWCVSFNSSIKTLTNTTLSTESDTGVTQVAEEETSLIDRISLARGRYANRNLSEQGDLAMLEAHYSEAKKYYAAARLKTPNDTLLLEKYATSLYNMKQYSDVIDALAPKITSLSGQTKEIFMRSYTRSEKVKDENIQKNIPLSKDEQEYLRIVRICITWVENFIVVLNEYNGWYAPLKSIKDSYANSSDITQDRYYRDSIIAGAWYKVGEPYLSNNLIKTVLTNRPDYIPAKKIAAFSAYDMWYYKEANDFFISYLSQYPLDAQSLFALWQTKIELEDWIGASDVLNRWVLAWYIPKIDIERKIIQVDAQLKNYDHMLTVFGYILKDNSVISDDYSTALLIAIIQDSKLAIERWSEDAYKKYPNDPDIIAYYVATRYLLDKKEEGDTLLSQVSIENNSSIIMEYAKLLQAMSDQKYTEAQELLNTISKKDREKILEWILMKIQAEIEKKMPVWDTNTVN